MVSYWPLNLFQPIWIYLKVWAFAWIYPKIILEKFDVFLFISGPDHFSEKKAFGKQQIKKESKVSSSQRNMEEERKSNCDSEIGKELYSLLYFWLCCLFVKCWFLSDIFLFLLTLSFFFSFFSFFLFFSYLNFYSNLHFIFVLIIISFF